MCNDKIASGKKVSRNVVSIKLTLTIFKVTWKLLKVIYYESDWVGFLFFKDK